MGYQMLCVPLRDFWKVTSSDGHIWTSIMVDGCCSGLVGSISLFFSQQCGSVRARYHCTCSQSAAFRVNLSLRMHWIYSFCPALGVVATSFFCGIFIRELGLGDSFDWSPHQFVDYSLVPFSLVPVSPFGVLSCIDSDLSSFSRKRILSDFHPYDISGSSDGLDRCERSAWLASVSSVGCRVAWDHHAFAQEAMAAAAAVPAP